MTVLTTGARDLAASPQEECVVYAASFGEGLPVPQPVHWDRRDEGGKSPYMSKKRHYEATLVEGSATPWIDAKRRTTSDNREATGTPETPNGEAIEQAVKEGVGSEQKAQSRFEQVLKSALGLGGPAPTSKEEEEEGSGEGVAKENVEHNPRFSIESMASPRPPPTPGDFATSEEKGQDVGIDQGALDLIRSCREERQSFEASIYAIPK